jgi:hypothetical protein
MKVIYNYLLLFVHCLAGVCSTLLLLYIFSTFSLPDFSTEGSVIIRGIIFILSLVLAAFLIEDINLTKFYKDLYDRSSLYIKTQKARQD